MMKPGNYEITILVLSFARKEYKKVIVFHSNSFKVELKSDHVAYNQWGPEEMTCKFLLSLKM